jgi:hypothetical protein
VFAILTAMPPAAASARDGVFRAPICSNGADGVRTLAVGSLGLPTTLGIVLYDQRNSRIYARDPHSTSTLRLAPSPGQWAA